MPVPVSNFPPQISALSVGGYHTLVIENGHVLAWGVNNAGQIGNGTSGPGQDVSSPTSVLGLGDGVTAVSASPLASMALKGDQMWVWGQLGNGTTSTVPVQYAGLENGITAIAAGGFHRAVIQNGTVKVWGRNDRYQLGQSGATPTSLPTSNTPLIPEGLNSGVTAIAAGSYHTLALKDGKVYHWGQIGTMSSSLYVNATPQMVLDSTPNIVQIAAGESTSFALSSDGSYWAWGENDKGQLGTGVSGAVAVTPQQVLPPQGFKFTRIGAGAYADDTFATVDYLTRAGDATLDGLVNFDDLLAVAQNYGLGAGAYWRRGDFNLDGAVNFADLLAVAQSYSASAQNSQGLAPEFAGEWSRARSLVPEPTVLSRLAIGFAFVRRTRRS